MKFIGIRNTTFALALASTAFAAFAAPKPKTLVIMLDGTRSDAIENGETPNFKRLMKRVGTKRVGTDPAKCAFYGAFRDFSPLNDLGSG